MVFHAHRMVVVNLLHTVGVLNRLRTRHRLGRMTTNDVTVRVEEANHGLREAGGDSFRGQMSLHLLWC